TDCPTTSVFDPIIFVVHPIVKKIAFVKNDMKPEPKSKLLDFVKPWDPTKNPGQTADMDDPSGPFLNHDARFVPTKEEVLKVKDNVNKDRFFRVITLTPAAGAPYFPDTSFTPQIERPDLILIGQELDRAPAAPAAQPAIISVEDPSMDKR